MIDSTQQSHLTYERITQILGCRWSLAMFDILNEGAARPSEIGRRVDGLAPRVMHRCLKRLEEDGLLAKQIYAEVPPRVEYRLTPKGQELVAILGSLRGLTEHW